MLKEDLGLNYLAIGSLPHNNVSDALNIVDKYFSAIPFWPQLAKFNKNEDMIVQFLELLPGVVNSDEKTYLDSESDEFFLQLEEFFMDYENVFAEGDCLKSEILDKYKISEKYSSTFKGFLELIKKHKSNYAKGQIVGPFTLATSLTDKNGKCVYYDETLREIIVKTLSLKALWQIAQMKKANPDVTPIIFIDEPSLSQLGTSAFITVQREDVLADLKEVSDLIKSTGAMSAIHCCGKCDWSLPIDTGIDIINLDGYFFAQNLSLFSEKIKELFARDGFIAWGIVPTLDSDALSISDLNSLTDKFENAIGYLEKKGIDKNLLLKHSLISPSCGAGSLSVELAEKAMALTKNLACSLKGKYIGLFEI